MTVLAGDGKRDLAVVRLVHLRHDVVSRCQRHRPVGQVQDGEVLRVQVEVAERHRQHDELEQSLHRVAIAEDGEHPGDAFEAHATAVLLVLLVAGRPEDLVEVLLVDPSLGGVRRTVVPLDDDGRYAVERLDSTSRTW